MTRIVILFRNGQITGFKSSGHADYAEEGSDIVCAAVSALTTCCINALETVAGIQPRVRVGDGLLEAVLPDPTVHDAQVIVRTMLQGLKDVSEAYPAHVRVICQNV